MIVTLAFFIVGSVVGVTHFTWWSQTPALRPIALVREWGLFGALLLQLSVFAAIAWGTILLERKIHGNVHGAAGSLGWNKFIRGPWPVVWGAVGLAVLNFATLALAGRPWGVTSAFALWGSKAVSALGVEVSTWAYWTAPARAESLRSSTLSDITSVMNFGILLGALAAAGLAAKFAPMWRIPLRSLTAAAVGGILLGYGARIAYGCNIGAFLGGIASSSLHGWLWFLAALAGTAVGTRLRPLFGMSRPPTSPHRRR
jgi:hypothetical protein